MECVRHFVAIRLEVFVDEDDSRVNRFIGAFAAKLGTFSIS